VITSPDVSRALENPIIRLDCRVFKDSKIDEHQAWPALKHECNARIPAFIPRTPRISWRWRRAKRYAIEHSARPLPALRRHVQIGGIRNIAISAPHINISQCKNGVVTAVAKAVRMSDTAAVSRKPV
jgi:hypothetical protein